MNSGNFKDDIGRVTAPTVELALVRHPSCSASNAAIQAEYGKTNSWEPPEQESNSFTNYLRQLSLASLSVSKITDKVDLLPLTIRQAPRRFAKIPISLG